MVISHTPIKSSLHHRAEGPVMSGFLLEGARGKPSASAPIGGVSISIARMNDAVGNFGSRSLRLSFPKKRFPRISHKGVSYEKD